MPLKEETGLDVLPFGLLELDAGGTILYYRPEGRENPNVAAPTLVGRNLLAEVTPAALAVEFQDRLKRFRRGHAPADGFHLTLSSEDGGVRARVLLAHIHERSETARRTCPRARTAPVTVRGGTCVVGSLL